MAPFKLTLLAQRDLRELHDFIARDNPAAAKQHLQLIKAKCHILANAPGLANARPEYHGLRMFPVGRYLIFYRPAPAGAADIEVIRVLHASRDIEAVLKRP